ncbi:uncharacterized protein LOC134257386 [Saccostrea cucullata]|uniref:uncharacterized protein LOC134257386 n=1 Tax=Saccostrea cuccullata TaxID=36930 RepID=UPI002ED4CB73
MLLNTFLRTCTKYMFWGILCLCHFLCTICVNAQRFVSVNFCPQNQTEWTRRARAKNCQNPIPDYLCATVQDNPGKYGEICTVVGLANPGTCAVLSKSTYNMDFVPCRATRGCPGIHYKPSELYKYPVCFQNFYGITTETSTLSIDGDGTTTVSTNQTGIDGSSSTGIAVVLLLPMLIVGTAVIIFFLYRRNKLPGVFRRRSETTRSEVMEEIIQMIPVTEEPVRKISTMSDEERTRILSKILELLYYLTHILKTELNVRDLKETIIINSVSLTEHFGEHLLKVLENVNDKRDYDNLEKGVVFTLLINFCNSIKPPRTGWGYKPSDGDLSVGADIERIRILWNLYCDGQVDVPNFQEVYRRMSEKFGELSDERKSTYLNQAEDNALELKIKIVILKRNCDVKDGVVVTKNIKSTLTLLDTSDIVFCVGAIGCGKTTAMRYIQDKYEDRGWRTVWFEEYINENELIENEINNVFLCCDNLFGTFNCNVFSLETITGFEHVIKKQRERCKGHLKVLFGIHQHVYDAVLKLGKVHIMDTKHLIDIDHLDKAEMLMIWKELKKEGHCVRDPSCTYKDIGFSSVLSNLSLSQGLVGNPFLMLMYCQHHDFFPSEEFTKSPMTTLVNHFERMKEEKKELFFVLVYIMFVRVYNVDQDIMPWAGSISAELTEDSVKRCVKKYPEYLIEENNTVELKHEILTISLFKASYATETEFSALVYHCDISTILQLTRPKEECDCVFVNCLPPSHTGSKFEAKLLERIAKAKGCPFSRPNFFTRKFKKSKSKS